MAVGRRPLILVSAVPSRHVGAFVVVLTTVHTLPRLFEGSRLPRVMGDRPRSDRAAREAVAVRSSAARERGRVGWTEQGLADVSHVLTRPVPAELLLHLRPIVVLPYSTPLALLLFSEDGRRIPNVEGLSRGSLSMQRGGKWSRA